MIGQITGLIILGMLGLGVIISGVVCLWTYGTSKEYNPHAITICPCCEQPDEKCYCNAC